jgi:hypothetical protein
VESPKKRTTKVKRNIQWTTSLDAAAVSLAAELGYYPEKRNGGVSKMLADLVLQEAKKAQAEGKVTPIPAPDAKPSRRNLSPILKRSSG